MVSSFAGVINYHSARYGLMRPRDMYKMVYQGAMGPGHAITCAAAAGERLRKEAALLEKGDHDEPLLEPLSPRFGMVRVNLRPFTRLEYDIECLLKAFVRTAARFPGDQRALSEELITAAEIQTLFPVNEMLSFSLGMLEKGLPAVHHSAEYGKLYGPAYRVVALSALEAEFPGTGMV
jgi:hypothetical protein